MKALQHDRKKNALSHTANNSSKASAKRTKGNAAEKKIFIADDDYAIIDVLTLMLEEKGYKIYSFAEGFSITDVNIIEPDLILLDLLMSGINGYTICKQLKAEPSTKHIPVIMISANKHAEELAIEACAEDFIPKPFEMPYLLKKVAAYTK